MERRKSRKVVEDFARTLRLNDLIGEYHDGPPTCPICGAEVVASEGKGKPFFWRCVEEGCYQRDIDRPPLQGGSVVCNNCAAPVEFGKRGKNAAWRCQDNRHHCQSIAKTHLRLPNMRRLIPKTELRKLDKLHGLSARDVRRTSDQSSSSDPRKNSRVSRREDGRATTDDARSGVRVQYQLPISTDPSGDPSCPICGKAFVTQSAYIFHVGYMHRDSQKA